MLMHHRVTDQDPQEICNMGCMRVNCFTNKCFKDVGGRRNEKSSSKTAMTTLATDCLGCRLINALTADGIFFSFLLSPPVFVFSTFF